MNISVIAQKVNTVKKLGMELSKEYSCLNSFLLSWQNIGVQFMALAALLETQPLPTALLEKGPSQEIVFKS